MPASSMKNQLKGQFRKKPLKLPHIIKLGMKDDILYANCLNVYCPWDKHNLEKANISIWERQVGQ